MNRYRPGTEAKTAQPSSPAPSSSHVIVRLILGVVVVIVLVAAMAAAALYRSRALYRDRALTATQNLAQLIERDFTAALDKVDLAVLSVKDEAESQLARGHVDARRLGAHITAQYAHQSGIDSLGVAGSDGTVEHGVPATSAPPINVADREYFVRAREDRAGLVISKPVVGRTTGKWTIVAARRINHPDGGFAGVAFASILTEQFEKAFAALDLGSYGAATLRNQDLQLIARHSRQATSPSPVGNNTVSRELADAVRTNPDGGTYLAATSLDNIERANTYRRVAKYPFYVLVGLATDDYLSIWRAEVVKTSALVTMFALVTALLTGMVASAWRRREADAQRILELSRAALRRSEHRLQHALESADMGVWSLEPETGDFEADAQARLLHGLPPLGPFTRESALSSILAEDRHIAAAALEAMRNGHPYEVEIRALRPDGTLRWIHLSGTQEPGSDARAGRLIGLVQDVTERRRAEEALRAANERLREADRRKDEFLGMLSHELRNPLAPIRSSAYILRHASPASDQARRALAVVERQSEHLTRIVDDLLDVTRIARGKVLLHRDRADLRDVVARAVEDARTVVENAGVKLRAELPPDRLWADADATRITQVVGNLLSNARKFTYPGGEIVVALREVDATAEITVRDTGAGIDPELLPTLFDAFVQAKRTLARSEGGLGLGLALVKGLVELHGGSVRAMSEGVGKGAEFVVTLPLIGPLANEQPVRHAPVAHPSTTRHVLIVDDNADAAESLAELVVLFGHHVEVAYDGPSAIEKARRNRPEVVLCDIGLPGMNGYDVARALRSDLDGGVRLVAVSGYAQPEDVERAREAGFDEHLTKPADPQKIEQLLA